VTPPHARTLLTHGVRPFLGVQMAAVREHSLPAVAFPPPVGSRLFMQTACG
jgi:hypothetical protein